MIETFINIMLVLAVLCVVAAVFLVAVWPKLKAQHPAEAQAVETMSSAAAVEALNVSRHAVQALKDVALHAQEKLHQSAPIKSAAAPPLPPITPQQPSEGPPK